MRSEPYKLRLVGDVAAGVAVGIHEQLGVGVHGDEGLEVSMALDQVHHVLHLDLGVSRWSVVGVGAGVFAGTGACQGHEALSYCGQMCCTNNAFLVLFRQMTVGGFFTNPFV